MKTSQLQLLKQKLVKIKYIVNENFDVLENKNIQLVINSKTTIEKNEKENLAILKLTINVFDEKDLSKYPFYLEMSNIGYFKWDSEIDYDILDTLLKSNGSAILLSYLRPLVTQFTSFSNYPPLILPIINFSDEN